LLKTILLAGFQHETNTFAPTKARYENFVSGEGHPAMCRGNAILPLRDVNIPAGGFIKTAEELGFGLRTVLWTAASPSAHVEKETYERIVDEIVSAAAQGGFDGVYLDLHGAMVAEHVDDGEGELLERIRKVVGAAIPIVASLDLHANVTERMLHNSDVLVAYRTYPHVDMAIAGHRAALMMSHLLMDQRAIVKSAKRLPFLIPCTGMCTLLEPAMSTYSALEALEDSTVLSLSFAPGFPSADFVECGPVVWGYGLDQEAVNRAVTVLYDRLIADEADWEVELLAPDDAVQEALRLSQSSSRPVVIADAQDNIGGGGDSNTVGMLEALLRHDVPNAAFGLLWNPEVVARAHAAGVGAKIEATLGGLSGIEGDIPFTGQFEVLSLSDGKCRYDGPMMHGMDADVGPSACLKIGGVRLAISTTKAQMFERNLFRMVGIHPESTAIVVVKSEVHFRADFGPIAEAILVAKSPGPVLADPADLPWQRLRPGIRLRPTGQPFTP
jgi:microcystin degradation protein MlrC